MKQPIIIIGLGELGSVFARGFLRLGYPVQTLTRDINPQSLAKDIPSPTAVLVAVGESDITQVLKNIPSEWQDKLILLQNELLPRDWQSIAIIQPTVISVWFEKKKGNDSKVVLPSPVFGPHAKLVFNALSQIDLPCLILDTPEELLFELVRKNLYIITTNVAGLEVGGNVEELAIHHAKLMEAIANDVLDIQNWLTDGVVNSTSLRDRLLDGLQEAIKGDPKHQCMGRSAPMRLKRALERAQQANLAVSTLKDIAQKHAVI
ncbi:hypothetical protein [Thiomicrorhabdus aquaedulcis]|uniref:hypothetical protein n=1 Tax=Thiomicrorhabdus aquaedulcis TaxID=2211106 RepID=UPI000FD9187C|nr:hypothetical protein [Thiomicrorhabdus aquaedulcis]